MKHLYLFLFVGLSALTSTAQNTRIAIKAGYNHNTARVHISDVKQPSGSQPGVNLGIQLTTDFEPPLRFTALLSYNVRGYNYTPLSGDVQKVETSSHYVNLAPLLSYEIATGERQLIALSVGPMAGLGLAGTQKITKAGSTTKSKMNFNTASNYGLFDLAIYSSVGYHFNKFFLEGSYYLGFVSINNNEESDRTNIKNRGLGISIGYYLR